jgi:hypothetical protein
MKIVDRIKNILLTPKTEWPVIAGESASTQELMTGYVAPLAGILGIIPALGLIGVLLALYGIYLLYLGLPRLMGNPQEKSAGYTAVVVISAIVIGFLISLMAGGLAMMTGATGLR